MRFANVTGPQCATPQGLSFWWDAGPQMLYGSMFDAPPEAIGWRVACGPVFKLGNFEAHLIVRLRFPRWRRP